MPFTWPGGMEKLSELGLEAKVGPGVSLELLTVAIPGCINASGVTLAFSRKGPAAKVVMQRQPHL